MGRVVTGQGGVGGGVVIASADRAGPCPLDIITDMAVRKTA
jgi:hypothetical protein